MREIRERSVDSESGKKKPDVILSRMLFFGLVAACMDQPNLPVGGLNVKIAFLVFPIYVVILFARYGVRLNRGDVLCGGLFLASLLPSVIQSFSPVHSVAFFVGACVCVGAMFSFSVIVSRLGAASVDVLVRFYRMTVIVTLILVALRIQARGCYTFYEPSYYTIALIPYFCIVFYRLSVGPRGCATRDCLFVLGAILASQSFSMVLWAFISLLCMRVMANKMRIGQVVLLCVLVVVGGGLALIYDPRTQALYSIVEEMQGDSEWFARLAINVGGNRVQRIYMAWEVASNHLVEGVGLGVFKKFVGEYLYGDDFFIMGMTTEDFILESNAVCVYLEILAEAGLFGLIGYLVILGRVHWEAKKGIWASPMAAAFLITMSALIIESSYLRPYVWALYGTVLGLSRVISPYSLVEFYVPRALRDPVSAGKAS